MIQCYEHWRGLIVATAIVAMPCFAATALDDEPDILDLEIMQVTGNRDERAVSDAAAGITVVGREQIQSTVPAVITDALVGEPGVFVQQTTPGQGIPIVRGLKGSEVLHLVDGFRLNNAFFRNAPNQYLALVDPLNIEQIEVLRGPAPTLYGADALGGVVQVLTPDPRTLAQGSRHRFRVIGQGATADGSTAGSLRWSGQGDALAATVGITYQDIGNRRGAGGELLGPTAYIARAADAKLVAATGNGEHQFAAHYLEQPSTPRVDDLVAGFGQAEPDSEVFRFEPNDRLFVHWRYQRDAAAGPLENLRLQLGYQQINDDRRRVSLGSDSIRFEDNRSDLIGAIAQAGTTISQGLYLSYGLEAYFDTVDSRRVNVSRDTGAETAGASRFPDGSTMNSYAAFVNAELDINQRLSVNTGLRYSVFDIDLPAADRGVAASLSPDDLTGNVNVLYRLGSGVSLLSNIGRGFRPPNIFDLATLGPRPGNRFNVANPNLGPESVLTADVGVRVSTRSLRAELFAFGSRFDDKITSVPTGETTADGEMIVQSQNANRVDLRGIEAGLRWTALPALTVFASLNIVWGQETFTNGEVDPADRVPPLNGRVGVEWRPAAQWRVSPFVGFADGQDRLSDRDVADARINPNGTPGWATLNLDVGWRGLTTQPAVEFGIGLRNLTDRQYRAHGSGLDAAGIDLRVFTQLQF